jgi:hypothetical protein
MEASREMIGKYEKRDNLLSIKEIETKGIFFMNLVMRDFKTKQAYAL